ncbi:MAG: CoA protein activase [bacterium]|nr:CoA protein activase [bacterium]
MGNLYIVLKPLFENLGISVVTPSKPNKECLKLGARLSPEWVCLPFKVNLGNLIDALDKGADTLLSVSGAWACRFGYYGRVQHKILHDLGYRFESIILGNSKIGVFERIREINGGKTISNIIKGVRIALKKAEVLEKIENLSRKIRPYEEDKGEVTQVFNRCLRDLEKTNTIPEIKMVEKRSSELFKRVKKDLSRKPLRVRLVGETYLMLEPFVNFEIERRLGEMGVEVEPVLNIRKWVLHPFRLGMGGRDGEKRARRVAKKYLPYPLGGEDQLTIGYTILSSKTYDGIVHVYPFTCMPENISRTVLNRVIKDYKIPVISLSIDEHSSPSGMITRLEAFIDLLNTRRNHRLH